MGTSALNNNSHSSIDISIIRDSDAIIQYVSSALQAGPQELTAASQGTGLCTPPGSETHDPARMQRFSDFCWDPRTEDRGTVVPHDSGDSYTEVSGDFIYTVQRNRLSHSNAKIQLFRELTQRAVQKLQRLDTNNNLKIDINDFFSIDPTQKQQIKTLLTNTRNPLRNILQRAINKFCSKEETVFEGGTPSCNGNFADKNFQKKIATQRVLRNDIETFLRHNNLSWNTDDFLHFIEDLDYIIDKLDDEYFRLEQASTKFKERFSKSFIEYLNSRLFFKANVPFLATMERLNKNRLDNHPASPATSTKLVPQPKTDANNNSSSSIFKGMFHSIIIFFELIPFGGAFPKMLQTLQQKNTSSE